MTISTSLRDKIRNKRRQIKEKSGQREDAIKIPKGKNKFRILPAKTGEIYWADFGKHFIKEPGSSKCAAVYVCTNEVFGKECDICQLIERSIGIAETDEQLEALEDSKPSKGGQVLLNVLHLNSSEPKMPQIMGMTRKTFDKILDLSEAGYDIADLASGTDLTINRDGTGMNTTYTIAPVAPDNQSGAIDGSVLKHMVDLQEYVKQEYEEGHLKALTAVNKTVGVVEAIDAPVHAAKKIDAPVHAAKTTEMEDLSDVMDAEFEEVKDKPAEKSSVSDASQEEIDDLLKDLEGL